MDYKNNSKKRDNEPLPTGDPITAGFKDEINVYFTLGINPGKELYNLATGHLQSLCQKLVMDYSGFRIIRDREVFQCLSTDLNNLL